MVVSKDVTLDKAVDCSELHEFCSGDSNLKSDCPEVMVYIHNNEGEKDGILECDINESGKEGLIDLGEPHPTALGHHDTTTWPDSMNAGSRAFVTQP